MSLSLFSSSEFGTVRVMSGDVPLFCARDVASSLGYANPLEAIRTHCKGVREILTPSAGGNQTMRFIPESDVYRLIMRSKLAGAERFQDWVMEEVLPAIRKTGSYSIEVPKTLPEALRLAADLAEKNEALALENEEMKPKAEFHDAVTASDDLCQLATACQVLGLPFGRNKLFDKLRRDHVLISYGDRKNLPLQKYVDQGFFAVKETTYLDDDRQPHVRFTTLVTQKGLKWLSKQYNREAVTA